MLHSLRRFDSLDSRIASSMDRVGVRLLRVAIGLVFVWFGALKLVPGLSPAEDLVKATVYFVDADLFYPILAVWEVLIGVLLLIRPAVRGALLLLALQMPGTFLPFIVLPEVCFSAWPFTSPEDLFALTMEGQYIVKNLVLIAAGLVVGGTVRERSTRARLL
ncbi:MAG: DoxX family protein [Rubricoccaceae bacterium]